MDKINYESFILEKTRSKFKSRFLFTDFSRNMRFSTYNFDYIVDPDFNSLDAQAEAFAATVLSLNVLNGPKTFFAKTYNESYTLLSLAYVYSYIKAVWYGYSWTEQLKGGLRPPQQSKLFYGHKVLYDLLCDGTVYTNDVADNFQIMLNIDCVSDIRNVILQSRYITTERTDFSKIYFDEVRGTLSNPQLESVLVQLLSDVNQICVSDMNIGKSDMYIGLLNCPLGNTCLSSDKENYNYLEDLSILTEQNSMFWGIANMVTLVSEDIIDSNDRVYEDFKVEQYDSGNIQFEVSSITGIQSMSLVRENLRDQDYYGGGNPRIPKD